MRDDLPDSDSMAAAWIARRDRNLSAAEQDEFLEWLRAHPRNAEAWRTAESAWRRLERLKEWQPGHSSAANPDLLAQPRRRRRRSQVVWTALSTAVAAVLLVVLSRPTVLPPQGVDLPGTPAVVRHEPQQRTLSDGSVVEWRPGTTFDVDFSASERRIILHAGEAHFVVAKNPARPFIVEAGRTTVRAVGTAFNVQHSAGEVQVLVTEGKVQVHPDPAAASLDSSEAAAVPVLVAGERIHIDRAAPLAPSISHPTALEIEKALSWQGLRLEFRDLPLREVVEEFNRHSRHGPRLKVADEATGALRIGGTFRAENAEAFIRLLESSFGVAIQRQPDGSATLRHR